MQQLVIKEAVCLLTRDEKQLADASRLTEHLPVFREVSIDATSDVLHLHLSTVNEEAAKSNSISEGRNPAHYTLMWEDLADVNGIRMRLQHEKIIVSELAVRMLNRLKDNMRQVRMALAVV